MYNHLITIYTISCLNLDFLRNTNIYNIIKTMIKFARDQEWVVNKNIKC